MSEIEIKNEENQAEEFKCVASIRFQNTKKPYTFGTNDEALEYGDYVVVETARGLEIGEMISSLRDVNTFTGQTTLKPIHRKATPEDMQMQEENKELAKEAMKKCAQAIEHQQLDMNLISCEYTLDRSKVIFIYVSENRVDFRELLKELTQIFKCRIELRQIGPRDKAKMVGGLGCCGMETCCSRFLDNFDVVSINMAKNQLLALNIPKLSGQCGKLMCCLKYEDALYKELRDGLPKMNAQLEYEGKIYRLTSLNVINGTCKIENKENSFFMSIDEMLEKTTLRKPANPQVNKEKEMDKKDTITEKSLPEVKKVIEKETVQEEKVLPVKPVKKEDKKPNEKSNDKAKDKVREKSFTKRKPQSTENKEVKSEKREFNQQKNKVKEKQGEPKKRNHQNHPRKKNYPKKEDNQA